MITWCTRCQSRPADMSREEASIAAGCGGGGGSGSGGDTSVRAGRRGKEIRVELRVPSEEVGERWTTLFRDRAALEVIDPSSNHLSHVMSPTEETDRTQRFNQPKHLKTLNRDLDCFYRTDRTRHPCTYRAHSLLPLHRSASHNAFARQMLSLFEPSPGDYAEGNNNNNNNASDGSGFDSGGGCGGGGEVERKPDTGFSVLGTGRFSRVVWARRKRPWARIGTNVCAIKVQNIGGMFYLSAICAKP